MQNVPLSRRRRLQNAVSSFQTFVSKMPSFTSTIATFLLCTVGAMASFDWATANSSVWLSAGAYCETNTYMTRTYKGYSAGFVPAYVIDDKGADVQVYF